MKFFEKYFSDVDFYKDGAEEVKVLCPFHSDTVPSASININKSLFHCWVCGVGYNEQQFMSKVNNISIIEAGKILNNIDNVKNNKWEVVNIPELWADTDMLNALYGLRLKKELIEELKLGIVEDSLGNHRLGIPIYYNGILLEVRSYDLLKNSKIKMLAEENVENGNIFPYDLWQKSENKITYILEGEKDVLVARAMGINAICLTGGAGALPNDITKSSLKDKDVILCYDNDKAGKDGMSRVYAEVKNITKSCKYISISDLKLKNKEDFTDAVFKYNMDIWTFYSLQVKDFPEIKKEYITIKEALNKNIIKKKITSIVSVSGEFSDTFAVPAMVSFRKMDDSDKNATMSIDEVRTWYLEEKNFHQILGLIENDAKKEQVINKIKSILGIPKNEKNLKIQINDYLTVFKSRVRDLMSDGGSLDIYSFYKLDIGYNYEITYKIQPHPTKNQKLVVLATNVLNVNNDDNFKPNKELLDKFIIKGSMKEKLNYLYENARYYIAPHLDYNLWLNIDLALNSVLEFDYNDRIKGALDIFILGDTQVGKSESSSKLVDLYGMGKFLSLKTSTTVGLIGGSSKVDNSWLNTIGAIPRQNKKAVIMEEFSGAKPDFIKTMTDIRSSGKVRIARAAGEIEAPCRLRMITLSNAINDEQGNPRHLKSFPNGIMPLMELIKSAEDVARYDGFYLIAKPEHRYNPFKTKLINNPIPQEAYQHKLQWVWTRKPENIIFEEGIKSYIWDKANKLNELFECNFPLFGTTTPLKLARYSVALAALTVTTDEHYNNVIVNKEIVDTMFDFLVEIYDNDLFKLGEYKKEYDSYSKINTKELKEMQELYAKNSTLFEWINNSSTASRNDLQTISGLKSDDFSPLFNRMVALKLIKISGTKVFPTPKFRIGMRKIDKTIVHDTGQPMITLDTKL